MAQPMSDLIANYNLARDREQYAFEVSPLGQAFMHCLNGYGASTSSPVYHRRYRDDVRLSLAAEVAFKRSMPAFYAGRALGLW